MKFEIRNSESVIKMYSNANVPQHRTKKNTHALFFVNHFEIICKFFFFIFNCIKSFSSKRKKNNINKRTAKRKRAVPGYPTVRHKYRYNTDDGDQLNAFKKFSFYTFCFLSLFVSFRFNKCDGIGIESTDWISNEKNASHM